MDAPRQIDPDWRREHPLPAGDHGADKNARGRLLLVGGSLAVPGGLRLTAEAAMRAGAGKVQVATVAPLAVPLGLALPEAGIVALPADDNGEIAAGAAALLMDRIARCDTLLIGPAMGGDGDADGLLAGLLAAPAEGLSILLDAAAIPAAAAHRALMAAHSGRIVLTPHHGEMARLCACDRAEIGARPEAMARETAARFGAVLVLKDATTLIAAPDGICLAYQSDTPGLATAGSGDVLAGIIGALLARGTDPLRAAAWGVWLHGEAGREAARGIGSTGFLARELPPLIPRLLAAHDGR